jgi:hypothetical protein
MVSDFAAERLHIIAQAFSPALHSAKAALKVAAEARLWAVRMLFIAAPTSDATFPPSSLHSRKVRRTGRASFTNRQPRVKTLGCSVKPLRGKFDSLRRHGVMERAFVRLFLKSNMPVLASLPSIPTIPSQAGMFQALVKGV